MNGHNTFKAQSAMEYLMTYGWAILIISIVLGSLFSLGVFSTSSFLSTSCIPSSGYYCSISSYVHGGNVIATIGQSTGTSWTQWAYYFCSGCTQGTTGPTTSATAQYNALGANAFASGAQATVSLTVPTSTSGSVGTTVTGSVWVCYVTASAATVNSYCLSPPGNTVNFAQIATLTAKST